MIDDTKKERLRTLTVEVLLDLKIQALRNGWNPLDLWDQLASRARASANVSANPEEWCSDMLRRLRLSGPSKDNSASSTDLAAQVREWSCAAAWLTLLDKEHGYLIALARRLDEERRAARNAPTTPTETPHV